MKNLFLFLFSIILGLFISELLVRYVFINEKLKLRIEANKSQFKDFQKLTWNTNTLSFIPQSIGEVKHPEYKYTISHDKIGFRNPCSLFKKKSIKEIIIGDSFVYGVGVKDKNTLNCKIENDNYTLGVPNSSPKCYLQLLERHYSKIRQEFNLKGKINIHIILYIGNDFEKLITFNDGCPTNEINQLQYNSDSFIKKINYILTKGFLSQFYLPQIPKILYKNYKFKKKYKNINLIDKKYFLDNGNDTFYINLNHINQDLLKKSIKKLHEGFKKIDKDNLDIYLYLMPSASDISEDRLKRKSKISGFDYKVINTDLKYNSILNSCNELNIICNDLRKFFIEKHFYYHDTHLNSDGVAILSKIINQNAKKIR